MTIDKVIMMMIACGIVGDLQEMKTSPLSSERAATGNGAGRGEPATSSEEEKNKLN